MGSDKYGMQLDGVGGGISSTSKVAIVDESVYAGHDVDYTFGQVSVHPVPPRGRVLLFRCAIVCAQNPGPKNNQVDMKTGAVDWSGSCGNLASAVALFALDEGLVKGGGNGASRVKIFQTNLQYSINVGVPAQDTPADHRIPGIGAPGQPITVDFVRPRVGNLPLLPTGRVRDTLHLPTSGNIEASIVCAANPTIFVRAQDLGLESSPFPPPSSSKRLEPLIEAIRLEGSRLMGLPLTDAIRVSWISASTELKATDGAQMRAQDMDLAACITTPGRLHHHAFTGTGAINLACLAAIPNSLAHCLLPPAERPEGSSHVRLAQPAGIMTVQANCARQAAEDNTARQREGEAQFVALSAGFVRTARRLFSGEVHVH
eukprot:Tamp_18046.p1 GENE.Tamp_18046~~Tamp_18046.p1  ORF type:complete len:425 (+),score=35.91 Tamp_18046:157-1275(+)